MKEIALLRQEEMLQIPTPDELRHVFEQLPRSQIMGKDWGETSAKITQVTLGQEHDGITDKSPEIPEPGKPAHVLYIEFGRRKDDKAIRLALKAQGFEETFQEGLKGMPSRFKLVREEKWTPKIETTKVRKNSSFSTRPWHEVT